MAKIFEYKIPGIYPVDAQTAGEELERIYTKNGSIEPKDIVDESRSISAPLHPCFEWNDKIAAEKYRENQASDILRSITIKTSTETSPEVHVRAFVTTGDGYVPITTVISDEKEMDKLLSMALKELLAFKAKYSALKELAALFEEVDNLQKKI